MDLVYFLGRLHVLVLHLPIGLILIAVLAEFLLRTSPDRADLEATANFLWAASASTAIATMLLGYMHFAEGGFDGPSGSAHRLYGTCVAVGATLMWLLRRNARSVYRLIQMPGAVAMLVLVTVAGHYGGNLTHGSTYLVEYAPRPIRQLAGLDERRPPVTDLESANAWLDVVKPILDARCASCHGRDKQNADFDVSTYASTIAGGETGSAVVPGNLESSELYRRITLPEEDEAFMPAEGRRPLTDAQVAVIGWWIEHGAPSDRLVGALDVPPNLEPALLQVVGLVRESPAGGETALVDAALIERLAEAGFVARPLSLSDTDLTVSVASPGQALDATQLQTLAEAAAEIRELNLQSSGLADDELEPILAMTGLTRLRLDRNELTDAAVESLATLESLEYLNLYGNVGITDASVETLATMPNLSRLYVWETGITAEGIERLRSGSRSIQVQGGSAQVLAAGVEQPSSSEAASPRN